MADRTKRARRMGAGADGEAPPARPIRPFILGAGIAAAWGALDMPTFLTTVAIGDFAAELVAIAIVCGGILAALIELLVVMAPHMSRLAANLGRQP